jgi:hypothetical protein
MGRRSKFSHWRPEESVESSRLEDDYEDNELSLEQQIRDTPRLRPDHNGRWCQKCLARAEIEYFKSPEQMKLKELLSACGKRSNSNPIFAQDFPVFVMANKGQQRY